MERCHFCSNEQLQCSLIAFPCKTWGGDVTSLPACYPERGCAGCCVDDPPSPQESSQSETKWSKTYRRRQGNNNMVQSASQTEDLGQSPTYTPSGCL